jgi:hypothetical protein
MGKRSGSRCRLQSTPSTPLEPLENPLGCYDVRRYDGDYDAMARELMSVFEPDGFTQESTT